ncbi:MAG: hypothetical protein RL885_12650 [Planctomycetota bacterium]
MSSPNDPLRSAKRHSLTIAGLAAVALAACVAWALSARPAEETSTPSAVFTEASFAETQPAAEREALDAEAFEVELWNPPPPEEEDATANESVDPTSHDREIPISLELIAITEGEETVAAVYDPKEDTLHLVRIGDTLQRFRVQAITANSLRLHDGRRIRDLKMERADR